MPRNTPTRSPALLRNRQYNVFKCEKRQTCLPLHAAQSFRRSSRRVDRCPMPLIKARDRRNGPRTISRSAWPYASAQRRCHDGQLPSSHGSRRKQAIEKTKASLRYLPEYSPDLNPIELPYSKFKPLSAQGRGSNGTELTRAIRSCILNAVRTNAPTYFAHAGYVLQMT